MRNFYAVRSVMRLKKSLHQDAPKDYWQAGKSVAGIEGIIPAGEVVRRFAAAIAK
jgi:nitronate monooxygenase